MIMLRLALQGFIRLYQMTLSPLLGTNCRFEPSCSHYAHGALCAHGVLKGSWLAAKRLLRCQPWGGDGFDPVPDATRK